MPSISSGSNATFTVPSGYIIDIQCPGGWVQLEYPVGTKVFEGNPAGQTFGPYAGGSYAKLTSVKGDVYYEVDPSPASNVAFDIGGASKIRGTSVASFKARKLVTPNRSRRRAVMASPPAAALNTTTTIASPTLWPSLYTGASNAYNIGLSSMSVARAAGPIQHGTISPDYEFVRWTNVNYGGGTLQSNVYMVSVDHDGSAIEFYVKGVTGAILCKVDDEFISLTPTVVPNDGGKKYYYIPFGSTKERRIDFICYNSPFGGIYTAATDTIKPAALRGPRCIVVGDSFVEGTGSNNVDSWVNTFAEAMGWDDVWSSGVGSTGYLATSGSKVKYRDRFATDVAAYSPDVVMFTGGINDEGTYTAAQLGAEATLLFQQAQAALPNALLVAVAPFYKKGAGGLTQRIVEYKEVLRTAIQSVGGVYIDPLEQPLPTGYTPVSTTLASGASAGATSLVLNAILPLKATAKFPDGTRFQVKAITANSPFTVTTDQPIANTQASGATVTQVGDCYLTGNGRVGATTGYGNADVYVGSDATHPTAAGHIALAAVVADLLITALSN